jgi:capsular exopolysaccharide synthesis family protein
MDTISPQMLGLGSDYSLFTGKTAPENAPTRVPPLRRLLRIIRRWRWVLIGGLVTGALFGILVTLLMTRQYASTVRLQISRETAHVVNIDSVERDTSVADQEFYQTQYGLLQAQVLAERVARDLGVVDDPNFFKLFGHKELFADGGRHPSDADRAKRNDIAGRILLSVVGVAPVRGSSLVDVRVVTPDPALSQRIAAIWARDFIATNLERRYEASSYARHFLEVRLEQLREKLETSEREEVGYAAQQGIVNLPAPGNQEQANSGGGGTRSMLTDDLTALNSALETATTERIIAQSRLREVNRPDASAEALSNDAINALRQKRAEAASDYAKLMAQLQPKYPQARAIQLQIQDLDKSIAQEENRVRTWLRQTYASTRARELALTERVNALKANLNDLRRRTIQYNIYQRDADTNRELYNALLQRYKEIGVAGGIENNNVAIADPPRVPDRPSSPRLLVNLILSILAGGVIGAAVAGVLEQIDEGISNPAELEEKLDLPLLGTAPKVVGEAPLEALQNPRSLLVEAYLAVQANLELSTAHGTPRSIAVISTRPREGKSTTTIALAQSLARARRKVVLIDADMRSPSVHSAFGIANTQGVSNFLAGVETIDDMLYATGQQGLSVMTAGPQPPNAAELLTGDRLTALVQRLQEQFDHVIVDAPPVIGLADAPLVGAAVQGVIFVVEARSIQAGTVRIALGRMRTAHVNILGAILTKFEAKHAHLGYGYDYGYGYGYGQ